MKKIFFPALMLFFFTSCVTLRERGDTSLPTWRTFHARFDRVWGVLVSEISSFAVIKTIDKTNGLITTEPLKMGSGLMSEILLKLYVQGDCFSWLQCQCDDLLGHKNELLTGYAPSSPRNGSQRRKRRGPTTAGLVASIRVGTLKIA